MTNIEADHLFILEDRSGNIYDCENIDKFIQIKIQRTWEEASQNGKDCIITRVAWPGLIQTGGRIIDARVDKW